MTVHHIVRSVIVIHNLPVTIPIGIRRDTPRYHQQINDIEVVLLVILRVNNGDPNDHGQNLEVLRISNTEHVMHPAHQYQDPQGNTNLQAGRLIIIGIDPIHVHLVVKPLHALLHHIVLILHNLRHTVIDPNIQGVVYHLLPLPAPVVIHLIGHEELHRNPDTLLEKAHLDGKYPRSTIQIIHHEDVTLEAGLHLRIVIGRIVPHLRELVLR
jgi:hypothetical protein